LADNTDVAKVAPYEKLTGTARAKLAAQLAELYQRQGESIRDLMSRTGRSYGAIYRLLTIDAGITLRPRGGANNPHGGHATRKAG
jgi:glycine cleavage system regulatory protein